ncbi:hypothetical protein MUCCIDRAFT_111972 [Mucor lusitanicus CBS 277.49]|uniref:PH domain-containing protein n=1 Tax=Mucor lusitanicus CBS 277.49 TaxID=747725 RepID=A0A162T826_MUCCL|nr:hypothetical protein MUCCIDRAFT_111972 [Mucor lusitanicus CBS 277.49]
MLSLTAALKKKKTSAVGPEQQHDRKLTPKSPSVTNFLSRKVSSIHAKKIWHQIISQQQQQQQKATVLFDSNDHLADAASIPPTPPPKKSSTMPNLSIITDAELMHRALPSLPSVENAISVGSKSSSSRYGLTRATTWVGKSIQKWLSNLEEQRKAVMMDLSDFEHDDQEDVMYSSSLLPNALDQKLTLHCRILQVTNVGSAKNYQYTMNMRVTNNQTQTHTGVMKRVAKGISAAHPRAALSFNVQGRFQVECDLCIKPFSSNSIVNRLKSFRSRLDLADHEEDEEQEEIVHQGQLVLDSGADPLSSFANKGIERYSIQTSTSVALELTIAFWLEEADKQQEQDETDSEEEELYTPIDQDVLRYCQAGDYLTFYVKSDTHPSWNRYWVTYQSNQLVLRLNERGAPVDKFHLKGLNHVDINPSDDIKEEIYLGKKHGIVLTFGGNHVYLFCDHFQSVRFWKCLLEQHASNAMCSNRNQQKYLWVAQ